MHTKHNRNHFVQLFSESPLSLLHMLTLEKIKYAENTDIFRSFIPFGNNQPTIWLTLVYGVVSVTVSKGDRAPLVSVGAATSQEK